MTGPILVTPGDPRGVGYEVTVKVLRDRPELWAEVIGDRAAWGTAVALVGADPERVVVHDPGDVAEPVEVASIRLAVARARAGEARAVVTGPIHKARLAARGFPFAGHTEFLAHLCGVDRVVMAFVGGRVRLALATTHIPLSAVAGALSTERVLEVTLTLAEALRDHLGLPRPKVWVCGLNPHAGDGGLLGREDLEVVAPAVERARAAGVDAVGPVSAEAAFVQVIRGHGDGIVAMYHDQGLVALKALDFGRSVNWTLGLPIVRTSVDHGTAYDIAGKGIADPGSLHAAVRLAEELTAR